MPDKQISQFDPSAPVDTDIFHAKKNSGEDVKITFLDISDEVLSRVPASASIISRTGQTPPDSADVFEFQRVSDEGYRKITFNELKLEILKAQNPVGSLYLNYSNSANPSTLLGFGTWARLAQGRVLIGEGTGTDVNATNQTFNGQTTGGEYSHALTEAELAAHDHYTFINGQPGFYNELNGDEYAYITGTNGRGDEEYRIEGTVIGPPNSGLTSEAGSNTKHNNVQPYVTVYIWYRVA